MIRKSLVLLLFFFWCMSADAQGVDNKDNTFKEVILPIAQIFSTLLIGGALAFYLNRRTNKDKVKGLLIDSYIDYLSIFNNFKIYQTNYFLSKVLLTFLKRKNGNYSNELNTEMSEKLNLIQSKYDKEWFQKNANLVASTYKFTFLLGVSKTKKVLGSISDTNAGKIISDDDFKKLFINRIVKQVEESALTDSALKISNPKDTLEKIDAVVLENLEELVFKEFERYSTLLAEEILSF